MPFGEQFIDQRQTGHDIRFKFTGKERDAETGFDYFGARYYDSDISVWLSVDPLAFKYPNESPYSYVGNRPINTIDPWGMDKVEDPNGNKGEAGAYKQTKDKKYLYGDGLKTKVWDPDLTVESDGGGTGELADPHTKGGYVDYEGADIDFENYGRSASIPAKQNENSEFTVLNNNQWKTQAPHWTQCFTYCSKIVGYTPQKSHAIYIAKENGNKMTPLSGTKNGMAIIDKYLKNGKPIIVGVNHTFGNTYNEGTTDHFIVMMGYGYDNGDKYYRFFDVGTTRQSAGTSPTNRLYVTPMSLLVGRTAYNHRLYTVSQVRPR